MSEGASCSGGSGIHSRGSQGWTAWPTGPEDRILGIRNLHTIITMPFHLHRIGKWPYLADKFLLLGGVGHVVVDVTKQLLQSLFCVVLGWGEALGRV